MESDHPPVDILRLGARGAAVAALFAGALRVLTGPLPAFDLGTLAWVGVAGAFVSAAVVGLLLPRFEAIAGAALIALATLATVVGGGVDMVSLLGWSHGYALLFCASGMFFLSAWGWALREGTLPGAARPVEDPQPEEA